VRAAIEKRSYEDAVPILAERVQDLVFRAHWHPDVELLCVLGGSICAGINQERRVLRKGDLALCGSGDIHYYERSRGGSECLLVIFKPELLGRAAYWPAPRRLSRRFVRAGELGGLAADSATLMAALAREMGGRREAYVRVARGLALQLCGLLERHLSEERGAAGEDGPPRPALVRMQRALDFIAENYAKPICLADAAAAASMSESYFSRVFSRTVGRNFRAYLNEVRIERAEELLEAGDATVVSIALEAGFESLRTFNRAFRALRGMTPKELRSRVGIA
jgi:AraC-like DNA-binding protein